MVKKTKLMKKSKWLCNPATQAAHGVAHEIFDALSINCNQINDYNLVRLERTAAYLAKFYQNPAAFKKAAFMLANDDELFAILGYETPHRILVKNGIIYDDSEEYVVVDFVIWF